MFGCADSIELELAALMPYRGGQLPLTNGRGWSLVNDPAGEICQAVELMIAKAGPAPIVRHETAADGSVVFHLGPPTNVLSSMTFKAVMLEEMTRDVYDMVLNRFADVSRAHQRKLGFELPTQPPPVPSGPVIERLERTDRKIVVE